MLAFLDHAPIVFESLHHALMEVAQSNGGDKFNDTIVVQIVSSAHGGTGSSIAAEVGFLVRQLAAEMEVPVHIELVLTCASPIGLAASDLMSATALSCLRRYIIILQLADFIHRWNNYRTRVRSISLHLIT